MVGKDVDNAPASVVGNDMLEVSRSFAFVNAVSMLLNVLLSLSVGNPQDMGINDAYDGSASITMSVQIRAAVTILFIIILPSSI